MWETIQITICTDHSGYLRGSLWLNMKTVMPNEAHIPLFTVTVNLLTCVENVATGCCVAFYVE
jgi:hypothetical protein